jgi:membrane fusion protein (multidrug efflux system)
MADDMNPRTDTRHAEAAPAAKAAPPPPKSNRKRMFAVLGAVVAIGAIGYGLFYVLVLSNYVSTDDAYVGADVAQITPQVAAQVQEVRVEDAQTVKKGDILVVLDPADANLAVASAQAQYGQAVRRVRQYLANNQANTAQIKARDADEKRAAAQIAAAQSDVDRTAIDLKRREVLESSGAVSGEELTTARNAYQTAVANLAAAKASNAQTVASRTVAQGNLASGVALTEGVDVEHNPEVMAAKAALDTALLNQSRTILRAPFDGVVAQRQVQVGQRIAVGDKLMTVVPVNRLYVDANFKEMQLKKIRVGQKVELTADRWGKGVKFQGRVQGLAGGTGAAFALIPAQEATGNWIKVVQRLPVRITLDPRELERHPLRVGLSMEVTVDVNAKSDGRPVEEASHQ